MWSGDLAAWAYRPASPEPLYSQATVDAIMDTLRYVVRVWVVGDDAYDPDAETERAVARLMGRGANVLRDAFEVLKTVEGEEQDESDKLTGLCLSIAHALALYD